MENYLIMNATSLLTVPDVNTEIKDLPLHEFFLDALQDMYWAENHLAASLPDLEDAATSSELKQLINDHLRQTRRKVSRLDQIFEMLEEKPKGKVCKAIAGIIKEANDILNEMTDGSVVLDVAIIMVAQKAARYGIGFYESLIAFADMMEHGEVSLWLGATLQEAKKAEERLSYLAESYINQLPLNVRRMISQS